MDFIIELLSKLDSSIIAVICIIVLFVFLYIIGWLIKHRKDVCSIFNQWLKRKQDKDALTQAVYENQEKIKEYAENRIHDREQSISIQKQLTEAIDNILQKIDAIQESFVVDKIENMRWKILGFANDLINGKTCYKEQFDNILKTYDDYEHILEENGMSNGQVEESMKFIREKYHELIDNMADK